MVSFKKPNTKVITKKINSHDVGLITFSFDKSIGKIGLFSVNPRYVRKGIARDMLKYCDNFYSNHDILKCEVTTQLQNRAACELYESYGYKIKNQVQVWHWWKNR